MSHPWCPTSPKEMRFPERPELTINSPTAAGNARSAARVADKLSEPSNCPAGRRFAATLWFDIPWNAAWSPGGLARPGTRAAECSQFRIVTEGNEGNEGPDPAPPRRFVPFVAFCRRPAIVSAPQLVERRTEPWRPDETRDVSAAISRTVLRVSIGASACLACLKASERNPPRSDRSASESPATCRDRVRDGPELLSAQTVRPAA
jgi:hypothetical protein